MNNINLIKCGICGCTDKNNDYIEFYNINNQVMCKDCLKELEK